MNLPEINSLELSNKKVLLRADLDVRRDGNKLLETDRLDKLLPTLNAILAKSPQKIIIIGHAGRPKGHDKSFSLKPIIQFFTDKLNQEVGYMEAPSSPIPEQKVTILENLRFENAEEENSPAFAQSLAALADTYINDAFASSHRAHASIVALPALLPHAAGLHLVKEVENLSKAMQSPARPVVFLISGAKEGKLKFLDKLKETADKVLVAGLLPTFLPEDLNDPKVLPAKLLSDKLDITLNSIEKFEREIKSAKTIVLSGPPGKYEDQGHAEGTKRILFAIQNSNALKIAGGGDTISAIDTLGQREKFNWISTGGGAMLEFLANKTLPGLEALKA